MKAIDIARVCHMANHVYCEIENHPLTPPWSIAPDWMKESALAGVEAIIADPYRTPEQSHESWSAHRMADGWVYGPTKDEKAKTHPCLVPYHELPAAQRVKDVLFVNIVRALMDPPERDISTHHRLFEPDYSRSGQERGLSAQLFGGDPSRMAAFGQLRRGMIDEQDRVLPGAEASDEEIAIFFDNDLIKIDEFNKMRDMTDRKEFDPSAPLTVSPPSEASDVAAKAGTQLQEAGHGQEPAEGQPAGEAAQADSDGWKPEGESSAEKVTEDKVAHGRKSKK